LDSDIRQVSAAAVVTDIRSLRRFTPKASLDSSGPKHLDPSRLKIFTASLQDIQKALEKKIYRDPRAEAPAWLRPVIHAFDRKEAKILPPSRPGLDHEINLQPGKSVPALPLYSMSREELLVLRKTLYDLLDSGFIRASSSSAAAPVIFVKKPGGGLRFCVDYRALNQITAHDSYPIPLISETLREITRCQWISKVDVISAFHRLRIRQGDEEKTAFRTRLGSYEWLVTPFGLSGAPASFQRYINHSLRKYLDICCSAYLDDVVIYSNGTREDHREKVRSVIRALAEAGLQLDWEKSDFESASIKYLGFIVESGKGIRADPDKIRAIQEWQPPKTVRGVRGFLGFANYYRQFIRDFSLIATPLTTLTKKDQKFQWTPKCQQAFDTLKSALVSSQTLASWDPTRPTYVEADSSGYALGGALYQQGSDLLFRPVAFFSRKLSPAEVNYPIHDKEMLAIFSCLRE
jgi:hypothetical protein